jgi:hypothetical protein
MKFEPLACVDNAQRFGSARFKAEYMSCLDRYTDGRIETTLAPSTHVEQLSR